MKRKILLFLLVLIGSLVLVACGGDKKSNSKAEGDGEDWPKGISISSATIGGTFHDYATGWGELIQDEMGISVNVEATDGPIPNMKLVESNDSPVGLVNMGVAYEGYEGIGWADKEYENIRSLFPMYISYLHWFSMPGANIENVMDLDGKVVGTGAKGGTPDYFGKKVFEDLDIKPKRIINAGFSDYADQMRDGNLDTAGTFSPTGHPTAIEMIKTENANIIGVGEMSSKLAEKYGISSGIIEANSYEGQEEDIETLTVYSAYIVNKNLSDDFVYNLVKTTYENKEKLVKVRKEFEDLNLDDVPEALGNVPIHPGAIKYYEEKGVELPDTAYPPEYKK